MKNGVTALELNCATQSFCHSVGVTSGDVIMCIPQNTVLKENKFIEFGFSENSNCSTRETFLCIFLFIRLADVNDHVACEVFVVRIFIRLND